jgi:plasmid stability protein
VIGTQLQLQERVYAELREAAVRQHRSIAACIREAVTAFLHETAPVKDDLADIAGRYRPLPMVELKAHDRVWAEATARERPTS